MHLKDIKEGDKLRRTAGGHLGMQVGDIGTVVGDPAQSGIVLREFADAKGCGTHALCNLEMYRPAKTMLLSTDAAERKATPITTGVLDYFPLALAEVAKCSKAGNDQHNPGQPLHWAKEKSADHADCIARHLIDRGSRDTDGVRHSAKLAWRALALLQIELEEANAI